MTNGGEVDWDKNLGEYVFLNNSTYQTSIGMSPNVRKGRDYGNLNYDWFLKSLDISALSFHKMLQTAEKLDAINEYGSVVGLSYIAAQRTFDTYGDMAQAKAVLESIACSYGQFDV